MLITSDFIFVHIPKTGGTFINTVVCELYRPKHIKMIHWIRRKLKTRRYCQHFISDEKYTNLDGYPYGQHCGLRHIPVSGKPVFHVKRPPEDYYRSLFYFAWYKKVPHLRNEVLKREFSNFPDLNLHELVKYYYLLTRKIMGTDDLKFGYLTYQIVDQLSPEIETRDRIFQLIQNDKHDHAVAMLKNAHHDMHIMNLLTLSDDLRTFLREYAGFSEEKLRGLSTKKKLNVSVKEREDDLLFLNAEWKKYELFAYKYWGYI